MWQKAQAGLVIAEKSYKRVKNLHDQGVMSVQKLDEATAKRDAAKATENQAMAILQPIVIDTHPLNNPWLNYSIYLNNTFAPSVLMLLIFMITVYSIVVEIKARTAREWLRLGNYSIWISLTGKLLPHAAIFFLMGISYNVYLLDSCISHATAASCPCCWPPVWYWLRKVWAC